MAHPALLILERKFERQKRLFELKTDALGRHIERHIAILERKKGALERSIEGGNPEFVNFLEALIERHRMPVIFRIRERYDHKWEEARKLLPVEVTSAIELDEAIVQSIGERVGEQTGRKVELSSRVDPEILGGLVLRVGNLVLDASIVNRLEQLRKQVAQA